MAEYLRKDKLIEYLRERAGIPESLAELIQSFPAEKPAAFPSLDDFPNVIKIYNPGPVPDIYGVFDR